MNIKQDTSLKLMPEVLTNYTDAEQKELIDQYATKESRVNGYQLVPATVLHITEHEVLLDMHAKANGVVARNEFKDLPDLQPGDVVEVYVEKEENKKGDVIVSRKRAKMLRTWQNIKKSYAERRAVKGLVKRKIKGGLVLDIDGVEAFLPGSQINSRPTPDHSIYLEHWVDVLVSKIDEKKRNVVVSRKALIIREEAAQRQDLMSDLAEGQVLSGVVSNITDFGVFINLGGVIGLLRKRDIASDRKITNVAEALNEEGKPLFVVGEKIEVVVIGFDIEKGWISLSTKVLAWHHLSDDIEEGSVVTGTVTDITEEYALIRVAPKVAGILHISQLSYSNRIAHTSEMVTLGQEFEMVVINIDRAKQELRLSLKALLEDPWKDIDMVAYGVGTRHTGAVCAIMKYGVAVELAPGIEGFLHQKHISWTAKNHDLEKLFSQGKSVKVVVLDLDQEKHHIQFGLRELQTDPWPELQKAFSVGSQHEATVIKKSKSSLLVALPGGLEALVPLRQLGRLEPTQLDEGAKIALFVIAFDLEEHKISLSTAAPDLHATESTSLPETKTVKARLGDFEVLRQLKEELTDKEKKNKKDKK